MQEAWEQKKKLYNCKPTKPAFYDDALTRCFRDVTDLLRKPYGNDLHYSNIKDAIERVRAHEDAFIRSPETFSVRLYNSERQFSRLIRHLFAKYSMPMFFDSVWYYSERDWESWFVEVARGDSLRTCIGVPINLTKKIAHEMMNAPSNYTICDALRYGQVMGLGGDRRLVQAVLSSRMGRDFADEPFRETVISWFVRNPMIDTAQISPLVDYIMHKFYNELDFSMKGRGVLAMIRQMEEWHNKLRKERGKQYNEWKPMNINSWEYVEGKDAHRLAWDMTEITNSKALREEGRYMHHCVAAFEGSCTSGRSSIFSLRCNGERALTLEVNRQAMTIAQMRGESNRLADLRERRVVGIWAGQYGLIRSKYL